MNMKLSDNKLSNKKSSDEKLSIKELAKHYIDKYDLQPKDGLDSSADFQEAYGKYIAQITRILKDTPVGEKKLWDIINPEKGSRQISINYFEKNCFDSWAAYIKKKCKDKYDRIRLEEDLKRHKIFTDESNLKKSLDDDINENNKMIENEPSDRNNDEINISLYTEPEISQRVHEMMLEAIYEFIYESFDRKLLASDMQNSIIIDNGYNAPVTPSQYESIKRLEDYHNYIGKKKFLFPYSEMFKKEKA